MAPRTSVFAELGFVPGFEFRIRHLQPREQKLVEAFAMFSAGQIGIGVFAFAALFGQRWSEGAGEAPF